MKKIIYIISILLLLLFVASCGNKTDDSSVEDVEPSENNAIEDENIIAVSEAEASENGGFYIFSDGLFYPLQKGGNIGDVYQTNNNLLFSDEDTECVPRLKKEERLVLFSDDDVADHYMALPVIETGFTVPAEFSEPTDQWGNTSYKVYGQKLLIEHYQQQTEKRSMESVEAESINDMSYADFFKAKTFHSNKFCSKQADTVIGDGCYGTDDHIFVKLEKDESVRFVYHKGTTYHDEVVNADIKYYAFDGCLKECSYGYDYTGKKLSVSLTDKPYAELDTSRLEKGLYVVSLDALKGGNERDYDRFIFEVE